MVGLTQLSEKHYTYLHEQVKLGEMREDEIPKLEKFLKSDKILAFFPKYYGLCTLLPELFDNFNSIDFDYDFANEGDYQDDESWLSCKNNFKIENIITDYITSIYVRKTIKSNLHIDLSFIYDVNCFYELDFMGLNYNDFKKLSKEKENFKLKNLKRITFYGIEDQNHNLPSYIDRNITEIIYKEA